MTVTVSGYSEDCPMVCQAQWPICLTLLLQSTSGWIVGRCNTSQEKNYFIYKMDSTSDSTEHMVIIYFIPVYCLCSLRAIPCKFLELDLYYQSNNRTVHFRNYDFSRSHRNQNKH